MNIERKICRCMLPQHSLEICAFRKPQDCLQEAPRCLEVFLCLTSIVISPFPVALSFLGSCGNKLASGILLSLCYFLSPLTLSNKSLLIQNTKSAAAIILNLITVLFACMMKASSLSESQVILQPMSVKLVNPKMLPMNSRSQCMFGLVLQSMKISFPSDCLVQIGKIMCGTLLNLTLMSMPGFWTVSCLDPESPKQCQVSNSLMAWIERD